MADKKISALTAATTPLAGTEVLPIVQSSSTVKVSVANLTSGRAVSVKNLLLEGGTLPAAGNPSIALRSSDNTIYLQSGSANTYVLLDKDQNTFVIIDKTNGIAVYGANFVQGTAAKGVNFTANTPAAGMTSQLLNWYEEGYYTATLTPGTSGSITVSSSNDQLAYTRIGRVVHVQGFINASSVSSPVGTIVKLNLPFNCASLNEGADYAAGSWVFTDAPSYTPNTKSLVVNPTTNIAELIIDASTVGNGDEFLVGFSYIAA